MTRKFKTCNKIKIKLKNNKYKINFLFTYLLFLQGFPNEPVLFISIEFFLIFSLSYIYLREIQETEIPASIYTTLLFILKITIKFLIKHEMELKIIIKSLP